MREEMGSLREEMGSLLDFAPPSPETPCSGLNTFAWNTRAPSPSSPLLATTTRRLFITRPTVPIS